MTPETRTFRNPESDLLVAELIEAFAAANHADVASLVRHACEEFDTITVLLGLVSIASIFIDATGVNYPGGVPAILAAIRDDLTPKETTHG